MWCGGVAWYEWIPLDPDRIMSPGWGYRVGMGDTNIGGDSSSGGHCTTQRTSVKLELSRSEPAH